MPLPNGANIRREVKRRSSRLSHRIDRGALIQQQTRKIHMTESCSHMERCASIDRNNVDIRSLFQQQPRNNNMTIPSSRVQRRSIVRQAIHVNVLTRKQRFHLLRITSTSARG